MYKFLIKNICFTLILFMLFTTSLFGQKKYNIQNISIPDGLSNSEVWDIVQDKYGFLWIATTDGLNRYDGYNFKIYKNEPGNKNTLPNNLVRSLMIDDSGILWVGTESGFCKYDRNSETFETFLPDSTRENSLLNSVWNIFQDTKKRIWLSTRSGIFTFDKEKIKKAYTKFGDNKVATIGASSSLLETSSGAIYSAVFTTGLVKYNDKIDLFEPVNVDHKNTQLFDEGPITRLFEDKRGKIWISSFNGLYVYDPHLGDFKEIKLFKKDPTNRFKNFIGGVFQDENGLLWVGTFMHGIFQYNMKTNEITSVAQSEYPVGISNSAQFWKFYKDDFGILWIGTFTDGLLKLDFQKEPFRLFANSANSASSNTAQNILSIYKTANDKDIVWLGTTKGLHKYSLKDKTFKEYHHIKGKTNSIPGDVVLSIESGSGQNLWLGTNNGLSLMSTQSNTFTNYNLSNNTNHYSINYNYVNNLSMDNYGNLWVAAGSDGVVKFNTNNKTKQYIPTLQYHTYNLNLLNYIDSINTSNDALAKITKVGDFQNLKKEFNIQKPTNVLIVSAGEGIPSGMVDYGWLENSRGK